MFGRQVKIDGIFFELNNTYHYKTATFDVNGDLTNMDPGDNFYFFDSKVNVYYGLTDWLTLFGGSGLRYVESDTTSQTVSNFNIEHFNFGARLNFSEFAGVIGSMDLEFIQKAYTNNFYSAGSVPADEQILGNDGLFYRVGVNLTKVLAPSHLLQTKVFYKRTPSYLGNEINYDFNYLYQGETFNLALGGLGIYSLGDHPFSNDVTSNPAVARGVTNLYNGINQEEFSPYVQLGLTVGKFNIVTRALKTISGVDTDEAFRFQVDLSFDIEGKDNEVDRDNVFKEYTNSAKVIKVAPRGNFFKINQGLSTNVEKGMIVDIYQSDFFGGNILVGSGVIFSAEADTSVVKLIKVYQKIPIKNGFIVRMK